jgi:hypothetical protein
MGLEEKLFLKQSLEGTSCKVNGRILPLWITDAETLETLCDLSP